MRKCVFFGCRYVWLPKNSLGTVSLSESQALSHMVTHTHTHINVSCFLVLIHTYSAHYNLFSHLSLQRGGVYPEGGCREEATGGGWESSPGWDPGTASQGKPAFSYFYPSLCISYCSCSLCSCSVCANQSTNKTEIPEAEITSLTTQFFFWLNCPQHSFFYTISCKCYYMKFNSWSKPVNLVNSSLSQLFFSPFSMILNLAFSAIYKTVFSPQWTVTAGSFGIQGPAVCCIVKSCIDFLLS